MIRFLFGMACAIALAPLPSPAAGPEVVSVEKIWDRAPRNAVTDLVRWRDRWTCTFREADVHVGGDGRRRQVAALFAEEGMDLRDRKVSVSPGDRLMIVAR